MDSAFGAADPASLAGKPLRVLMVSGGRLNIDGPLTIQNGRAYFKMRNGIMYSLPLQEIDVERTAEANGIQHTAVAVAQKTRARDETRASVAVEQAVTSVGLAARGGEREVAPKTDVATRDGRWTFFTGVSGLAESNINDEFEGTPDAGIIPSLGLNFRKKGKGGTIEASYTAGFHKYSRSRQWNRTSHNVFASAESRWLGRLRSETEAEVSLKGANEDRDLSDRYGVSQRFRLRLTENSVVRFTGGYRVKLYDDAPTGNARNPYGGIDVRHTFRSGAQWSAAYRVETNTADDLARIYRRDTASTDLMFPLASSSSLRLGVRRREQKYPNRLLRVDGEEVARQDERWIGSMSLYRRVVDVFAIAFEYQYETRFSNDPDKEFHGHSIGMSVIRFW
ncbi:MAG TPA: hypothetical protein VMS98_01445 [Thermoanaerobaculia bacterium]|nr:hypothetical protein [Thermoanaerobaculia bacterium]